MAVALLGLLLTLAPAEARAQRLYLRVVDMLGAAVTDLGPEENTVREDGVERALVEVRLANFPIKLMILVDNGDVMNNRLTHFRDGLTAMLQALPENQSSVDSHPRPAAGMFGQLPGNVLLAFRLGP